MEKIIKPKRQKLSTVLSTAILQALEDLELVRQDTNYNIDFSKWHSPTEKTIKNQFESSREKVCSVCFAGSVMSKRLNGDINKNLDPDDFPDKTKNMLRALDSIREGKIETAILNVSEKYPKEGIENIEVNQENYPTFVSQMKVISELLKSKGY